MADFGVSKILRPGTEMDTNVGTSFYRAPEVFTNTQVYTKQVDIWSMGIVLYFWYVHIDTGMHSVLSKRSMKPLTSL